MTALLTLLTHFPSLLLDSQLWDIKEYFSIPDEVGIRVPVEGEIITEPIVKEGDVDGKFSIGWTPLFLAAFSLGMRLPFSMFVIDLLEYMNRAPGQIHPCGWLNITIFQIACRKAGVQPTVPLFASLFSSKHRPLDSSMSVKGGGKLSKNFLAGPRPNKIHEDQFHGQWFFVWGGMGPRVPLQWTTVQEANFLLVRDTAFIKSQVQALRQAIPEKPSWKAYTEESALMMAGLIHDKMYNPYSDPPATWGIDSYVHFPFVCVFISFLYSDVFSFHICGLGLNAKCRGSFEGRGGYNQRRALSTV